MLGVCITYTTPADGAAERFVGSLAAVVVRPSDRRMGVGRSLHEHAIRRLIRTRDLCRLQLGSAFPRILYGLPSGLVSGEWFGRHGWTVDRACLGFRPGSRRLDPKL